MSKVRSWVGLDVHAQRTHASALDIESGELSRRRLEGPPGMARADLQGLPGPVCAVYEAGPTGYGLARLADAVGVDVRVCAPGLVPRKPADRVKTDQREADRLARLLAAGELGFVCVPTLAQEQLRDLVRAREDLRQELMRARHRLAKFYLRRERRYPGPGGAWTAAHLRWLEGLASTMPPPAPSTPTTWPRCRRCANGEARSSRRWPMRPSRDPSSL
jgi:transposase